jgi:hypothetical protein
VELVEAARTGQIALAAGAVERLARTTRLSGTQRGLGIEARSRALVSDSGGAEPLYLEASRAPASPAPVFPARVSRSRHHFPSRPSRSYRAPARQRRETLYECPVHAAQAT